ncbi:MAG: sensor histidine kinase [Silicimonas sp.]|nr:sensor histidine kinase [Silicimonas sp.]
MMVQSLRTRLIVIILTPLLLVSLAAAVWQFRNTSDRAEEIFDRGLLSAALAISRDVALSGGDALSPMTRELIGDTSGGDLFYHVYAPDGVFVTGYATPPRPPSATLNDETAPLYYDAIYQGRDVRVLRYQDATTVDGVTGLFTISVWQNMDNRESFVRDVLTRAFAVIGFLLLSVALIVWFGVGLGLRPLLDLQDAIAKRTPSELEPIRRNVPIEAQPIVSTLNALLDRVSRRISSKDEFISSAAHQLRNPIAGVLALAEAVENAPTSEAAKSRSSELVVAARSATHLTNQLLSFERAKGSDIDVNGQEIELGAIVRDVIERFKAQFADRFIKVNADLPSYPVARHGDPVMLGEALLNLMTNAVAHGGAEISEINVSLIVGDDVAKVCIKDNGIGIAPEDRVVAMNRFSQANSGPGSGLGLPIAARVAENHGGRLTIDEAQIGTSVTFELPV